ncbi:uncharacterized protein LACBIDRAFT_323967 [Laccaria bicolor S238N-H82]|uniref:Predicted protein n=1 Tax=Laccaria bicolor (strain S238N-H82 / ATCC MYA-4686) TaxID=486041 RepID=B0D073_LACBS|nr:uncharacterized protein LACBIDRAFT_323967 [Laccaria bicolor S238N-H82]EDR11405.1 predicted protein [Laccaria bicolor S238N-H82]|eukprot:XP_001877302.1 predicted protein [Laccaria bicolor S238N-H82]
MGDSSENQCHTCMMKLSPEITPSPLHLLLPIQLSSFQQAFNSHIHYLRECIRFDSQFIDKFDPPISTTVASSIESNTGIGGHAGRKSKRSDRVSTCDGQGDSVRKAWSKKVASPEVDRNKVRPTQFLALPLVSPTQFNSVKNNHPTLCAKIGTFQNVLLAQGRPNPQSRPIGGLDKYIVINPRRLNLTLGMMALEDDNSDPSPSTPTKKTPQNALALLASLRPYISDILNGDEGEKLTLNEMGWFPEGRGTARLRSPKSLNKKDVSSKHDHPKFVFFSLVFHKTSTQDGGVFQLHYTILNTSYREPQNFRLGLDIEDVLVSDAMRKLLAGNASEMLVNAGNVKVDSLGTYNVREVQLWVMGSHGPDNEYYSGSL